MLKIHDYYNLKKITYLYNLFAKCYAILHPSWNKIKINQNQFQRAQPILTHTEAKPDVVSYVYIYIYKHIVSCKIFDHTTWLGSQLGQYSIYSFDMRPALCSCTHNLLPLKRHYIHRPISVNEIWIYIYYCVILFSVGFLNCECGWRIFRLSGRTIECEHYKTDQRRLKGMSIHRFLFNQENVLHTNYKPYNEFTLRRFKTN